MRKLLADDFANLNVYFSALKQKRSERNFVAHFAKAPPGYGKFVIQEFLDMAVVIFPPIFF